MTLSPFHHQGTLRALGGHPELCSDWLWHDWACLVPGKPLLRARSCLSSSGIRLCLQLLTWSFLVSTLSFPESVSTDFLSISKSLPGTTGSPAHQHNLDRYPLCHSLPSAPVPKCWSFLHLGHQLGTLRAHTHITQCGFQAQDGEGCFSPS